MTEKKGKSELAEFFNLMTNRAINRQNEIIESYVRKKADLTGKSIKDSDLEKLILEWQIEHNHYLVQDIDLEAIYMVFVENGLEPEKSKIAAVRVVQRMIGKSSRENTKTRDRLDNIIKNIDRACLALTEYRANNITMYKEFIAFGGQSPEQFLTAAKKNVEGIIEMQFPSRKQTKSHDEITREIANMWREYIGEPKLHEESGFVRVMSHCLNLSPEVTFSTLKRLKGYKST